jgi:hypothetical protein
VAGLATSALVVSAETPEDPADRTHRHAQEAADARMRRWRQGVTFALASLFLITIAGLAIHLMLSSTASPDDRAWGRTTLAAVGSLVAGYLVGKKDKDP